MKKVFFALVALVCSMSMKAQVMKVMKGKTVVAIYRAEEADNVVFEEAQASTTTGTAKRRGNIEVKWVQLWENGPKFAEHNVGATSATEAGGYYYWGSSIDKDKAYSYNTDMDTLTGSDDTATNLWGNNWRMPTEAELKALLSNCDVAWTDNYKESGKKGIIFTGKGEFASNRVFFPTTGQFVGFANIVHMPDYDGYYWSSTPVWITGPRSAQVLHFAPNYDARVEYNDRDTGFCVRAVLAEN